ncbi:MULTISPECIES: relaxase/mobilization nuclease domain-containing protein [Sphingobacterium]|uniref:relaxase/mobilization nuclease domain-containing protein n=1 Tax=Sphingobacterium TaxID=28453 RepID=UPI0025809B39|nr:MULTISPECIES: relaxase/mobilization nuclease domain-containing protein [Sphingobacterium]
MNAVILDNKKGRTTKSAKNFGGVRYNTKKMDIGKGELMALRNFGPIADDSIIKPEEVKQYLLSVAQLNPRKEKKQFHAVISCRGNEYDKYQLTAAAHDWVKRMGYGDNPYLIVFHNDTAHNHVHIVSTRIDINTGKTIPDSYENVRAVRFINQVVKEKFDIDQKVQRVDPTQYTVTTFAQFKLLFEITGRTIDERKNKLNIYERNALLTTFDISHLTGQIKNNQEDKERINQLKAIFNKYLVDFEGRLQSVSKNLSGNRSGKTIGFQSDFTEFMRQKFGLQFIFHFSEDKDPYGYTIIDHNSKAVFKGSSIMKLSELTKSPNHKVNLNHLQKQVLNLKGYNTESLHHIKILAKLFKVPIYNIPVSERKISDHEKAYYRDLLGLYLKNNDVSTIGNLNLKMIKEDGIWYLLDSGAKTIIKAVEVLSSDEFQSLDHNYQYNMEESDLIDNVLNSLSAFTGMAASIAPDTGEDTKKNRKKKR